jgi:hypothetical protein
LEFDDLPDYEGLRNLFRGLAERMGYRLWRYLWLECSTYNW